MFRERIVPRAVLYFTGEALEEDSEFDEEESGDEDDDEDGKFRRFRGGGFFLICAVKISGPYLFIPCKICVKMFLFYKLKKGFLHSVDIPNAFGGVKTLMFLENLFDEY